MILSKEEMVCFLFPFTRKMQSDIDARCSLIKHMIIAQEEVVMKRCWLARYWGLAVEYGNSKMEGLLFSCEFLKMECCIYL
jgi:hypothetical protein